MNKNIEERRIFAKENNLLKYQLNESKMKPNRIIPYVYFGVLRFKGDWLHECYDVVQNRNKV